MKPFTADWWGVKALQTKTFQECYEELEARAFAEKYHAISLYCIKRALKAARREGYREGYSAGYEKGWDRGWDYGQDEMGRPL